VAQAGRGRDLVVWAVMTIATPTDAAGPAVRLVLGVPEGYDFARTVSALRFGPRDPATRWAGGALWRATRTPEGPAAVRLAEGDGGVSVSAWGAGAGWVAERAAALCGLADDPGGFVEVARRHPVVAVLAESMPGVRLVRTERVYEELLRAVLSQKVTTAEAMRSYAALVRGLGEPAPGPAGRIGGAGGASTAGLVVPPDPAVLAATPYWRLHPMDVERKRADTLLRVAALAGRLEEAAAMPPVEARRRLTAVPGVGVWTAAEVTSIALGDPDAVSVGDYHLPHQVAHALAGEPRGTDERMLELLAPFRGHRYRVARLIVLGAVREPRRAPRAPIRSYARF
jgi:3-methyladenine DNA glycosylase/8-oxoguanine DNA glycosylase